MTATPPRRALLALVLALGTTHQMSRADEPPLKSYFEAEVKRIESKPLAGITSAEVWKAKRPELHQQLLEMLGLWPLPEKTDLKPVITGITERPDFVVEKLHFQSAPGLSVTANLYRPAKVEKPLPAILYVCGHANVARDGVIYGNKAHYQHHAAWFAANGYVCLVLDTLQLGEIPGLHHGTYREGMWWWQTRGYTPAGIEAWNGVRALDYLCSRPEVDAKRLGVSGRSGGGATSWWLAAIDDRIAAAAPVAGITDLRDHVVGGPFAGPHATGGVVEGHCDCMFLTNTYRWDYGTVAALVAPRPLLVENTDADPIFPEVGVRRIFAQLETVYGWYGARDRLGLVIGKGGHDDTTELRHPAFAFFERWLKHQPTDPATVAEPDRVIPIEDLKVLPVNAPLPSESRNATIQQSFVARAAVPPVPADRAGWERLRDRWLDQVRTRVLAGWPSADEAGGIVVEHPFTNVVKAGVRLDASDLTVQPGVTVRVWMLGKPDRSADRADLNILDAHDWDVRKGLLLAFEAADGDPTQDPNFPALKAAVDAGRRQLFLAPRGIGPSAWPEAKDTHLRRRFLLLGQTLDGARVYDVRRALRAVMAPDLPLWLVGAGDAAPLALWAAVFEPKVAGVILDQPPTDVERGPAFLNLSRILDMPQAVALLHPRPVTLITDQPDAWTWTRDLGRRLDPTAPWPTIQALR